MPLIQNNPRETLGTFNHLETQVILDRAEASGSPRRHVSESLDARQEIVPRASKAAQAKCQCCPMDNTPSIRVIGRSGWCSCSTQQLLRQRQLQSCRKSWSPNHKLPTSHSIYNLASNIERFALQLPHGARLLQQGQRREAHGTMLAACLTCACLSPTMCLLCALKNITGKRTGMCAAGGSGPAQHNCKLRYSNALGCFPGSVPRDEVFDP